MLVLALGFAGLNTGPGRSFLVDRLADYRAESGLNVRVGRIEGSLFGRMTLHNVQLRDPRGAFAVIPIATVDWRPSALLRKKLDLRELVIPTLRVLRRPELKETPRDPNQPLLPDIDIAAPNVRIDRIVFEPAVTGRRHIASLRGSADLADGRAKLNLIAEALLGPGLAGGDRLTAVVDVLPAANRLRLDVDLNAPSGGLVDSYLGLGQPLVVAVDGRGDWKAWRGHALARLGPTPLLDLRLSADAGRFRAAGQAQPASLVDGPASRLLQPAVAVEAVGTLVRRRLEGRLSLRSEAMAVAAAGAVDLEANRLHDVRVTAQLLQPGALAEDLSARDVKLVLNLDGPLAKLLVDYELSAAAIGMGTTRIERLHASGRSRIDSDRILIPIKAKAARVTGLNAAAGGLLTNLTLEGELAYSEGRLLSDNLRLRSDRIDATAVIIADLRTGRYTGALKGRVNDYAVDGVGSFNLVTDAELTTGRDGGFGVRGSVRVNSRRLENGALRDLLGGQGVLTADLELRPGGQITVANLRLRAPDFRILSGGGSYHPDGRLDFRASAQSSRYGPLQLTAGGTAQRPVVRLIAASPNVGAPLRNVVIDIVGTGQGYRTTFRGDSPYGPLSGQATLRPGRPLTIDVTALRAAGVTLSGRLSQAAAGPFVGVLQVRGSGLSGDIRLSAAGAVQRVDADLLAREASLQLQPVVTIRAGRLTATALLHPEGPQVQGDLSLTDLRRAGLELNAARARGQYRDGRGELGLVARGESGTPFDLAAQASLTPRMIRANVRGSVNGVNLRLAAPAEVRRTGSGWRLSPTRVVLPRGEIVVAGSTGEATQLDARLRNVDLSLARNLLPNLGLQGSATGSIQARLPGGGAMPTASVRVDVDDFSRVALGTESPPVDIAVRGNLSGSGGDLSALIRRGGSTIGRVQARMAPLAPGAGGWAERLAGAPLSGGIRYSGPADVLWALTGIAGHEVSGPIAVAADFGGRVRQPTLRGVIRGDALRYENPTYATVVSNIAVRGHFTQSRLEITSLTGRAGSGTITARGWVGLDAAAGFPMDLRATLNRAQLASSDSIGASVSGSLAVTNSRAGGALISGELRIPEARYQIVRQGSAEVPVLEGVRRRGSAAPTRGARAGSPRGGLPSAWKLDLRVRADNQIFVSGMGLESEWGADLRVRGSADAPVVTGALDLVRGTYSFAGRRLELSQAEVQFDGRQATNPLIDIAASTTVEGVTATVNVTGRAQDPRIAFTSTPALPQDEVLSRLLFGSSVGQLSPTQAIQIAAALNSLRSGGGGGPNPLGRLRSVAGVDRLRILGADQASGRGTALAAGTYIGRNVYIEIITDARGFTATQLEFALSRTLSLLAQTASFGGSSVQLQYSRDY